MNRFSRYDAININHVLIQLITIKGGEVNASLSFIENKPQVPYFPAENVMFHDSFGFPGISKIYMCAHGVPMVRSYICKKQYN